MKYCLLLLTFLLGCQASGDHVETGTVKWSRDLEQSLIISKQSQKPVLLLFQEVPG